jgi:hypothetical protein
MTWHKFCLGVDSSDRADFPPRYLSNPTTSPIRTHMNLVALGAGKRSLKGLRARFTRLAAQQGIEEEQKQRATCSTRPELARARPTPAPTCPASRQAEPAPLPTPAPIKPPETSTVLPRTRSTSSEH